MSFEQLDDANGLREYYCDMHIHIGRTGSGQAVKISGSRNLTFENIAREAADRKGIEMIGIIDCHSPSVQEDIMKALDSGMMKELEGGGIEYQDTVILLGSEIEIRESGRGAAHVLAFFRDLSTMQDFTQWMSRYMKNVQLSSQRIYVEPRELQQEILDRGGILIPAHVFTPHKGLYGSMADRLADVFDLNGIAGIELGLSADSLMAGYISELDHFSFLTNSDAHSLGKIGREYNKIVMGTPSFDEFRLALKCKAGRHVSANYGLNPRLGKYHRTYCSSCNSILDEEAIVSSQERCPYCGSLKTVMGVFDRIMSIADRSKSSIPSYRPPYHYQVPLEFIPGLGKASMSKLLAVFGTEMSILHRASEQDIAAVVGEGLAKSIVMARNGTLELSAGGGGTYGKVVIKP
ncbi:endonuclease Q family protein [Paenibacillus dakarensis]|uniref:endonuclease Q family protein n=1 Tax=Paenibacillus dakarensis TaxID=1527293 RepID=UPI0006D59856|nr:endonuclease Q family protein [Paenibacillus dakarensis]